MTRGTRGGGRWQGKGKIGGEGAFDNKTMRRRKLSLRRKLTSLGSFTSSLRSFSPPGKVIIPVRCEKDAGRMESGKDERRLEEKGEKKRKEKVVLTDIYFYRGAL